MELTENGKEKALNRAEEIKENLPPKQLPQEISELTQYIKLRILNETKYDDLPDDLRAEIGTSDPMDEFIERVDSFDPWYTLSDQYGHTPDSNEPQWTIEELEELVKLLKG